MKRNLSKIVIVLLIISIFLPSFISQIQATDNQSVAPLVLQESESSNALVLDLKDAKDTKDLPKVKIPSGPKQNLSGEIKAKIKSFKLKDSNKEKSKQIKDTWAKSLEASVIANPVETGLAWLKNQQNFQGSWSKNGRTEVIDTSSVLSLFKAVGEVASSFPTPTEYQKALDWFSLTYPENSQYLAEKLITLAQAGKDFGSLAEFLASQINERDFGFGFQKDYGSDIATTAKVLKVITASNYQDSGSDPVFTLKAALIYLLFSQNQDGGWPKIGNGPSDIKTTALVLEALKPYQTYTLAGMPQGDIIIKSKIDLGINYLKNRQSLDGSWRDIEGTAKVYDVLLNYQEYPNYNQEALNYLTSHQNVDGSFTEQDIYLTAESLKTIAKPDIAVTDIQNISGIIPNQPTVAEVIITNAGFFKSRPINFKAQLSAFHLIVDGKEISLEYQPDQPDTIILEPNSTLILNVILLNLAFGPHTIKFSVDYSGVEFDKTNNQKGAELVFDDPGFIGPEPSSWVGASTNQEAGKITVRWLHSTDPTKTHYYLYLRPSSGNYNQYFDIPGNYNIVTISGFSDNIPYYFSVASVDENNNRGDYSMETNARAYDIPGNYLGEVPFSPKDNNQVLLYDVNFSFFGVGNVNNGGYNPIFVTTYPGYYYVTATKAGYENEVQKIELKPNETTEQIDFVLEILDEGGAPPPIQNLQAQAGDNQITLNWEFNDASADFKNFNIYRSFSEITNVSQLTPIDTSITNPNIAQFIDKTIINSLDYYYAITAKDLAGNENPNMTGVGPVRGNSSPAVSNIVSKQDNTGKVQIKYDVSDKEQNKVFIKAEYLKNGQWLTLENSEGQGDQSTGTEKIIIWNPKNDYPNYEGETKIKITADDWENVNNLASASGDSFLLDTLSPVNLSVKTTGKSGLLADFELSADGGISDATEMRFSNDADLDGFADKWSDWEPYVSAKNNFLLTQNILVAPYDERVIVEFKDGAGNTAQITKDVCQIEGPDGKCLECKDTDSGKDFFTKGMAVGLNVYNQRIIVADYCTAAVSAGPGPYAHEYVCNPDGKTLNDMDYLCPNGCENGAYKLVSVDTCTDTDGGKDYYTKGKVSGFLDGRLSYSYDDSCSQNVITEWYCDATNKPNTDTTFICPNGCQDGVCIKQVGDICTDTGDDFYVKDTVTIYKQNGQVFTRSDECMLDGRVQEQMCGDSINYPGSKNFFSKYFQCPNGCEDGACQSTSLAP